MHYVKEFNINGISTKQVACIELQGAPNAATEGAVGVLAMDMKSPNHDIYKCVAVNGAIYTWELQTSGGNDIVQTTGNSTERAMSQKAVTDELAKKAGKDEVSAVSKRVSNLESRLSDDVFITNSEVAYERAVPAPVAPYAAVDKIGGMTYAINTSKNRLNPAEMTPSWDGYVSDASIYGDEDGNIHIEGVLTEGDYASASWNITPPGAGKYTFSADYENISGNLEFYYSILGLGTDDSILTPNGDRYTRTFDYDGTGQLNILFTSYDTKYGEPFHVIIKTMLNEGETALPWESPNKTKLLSTPVTKLESMGKNLLDLTPGLNSQLVANGDGSYTMSRTSAGRFSAQIPIHIPAGITARCRCKINGYSNSSFRTVSLQFIKSNGNSNFTVPMQESQSNAILSSDYDIVGIKVFMDSTLEVGDYITFSEPQIEIGTVATDYAPYSADPIDTFEIPLEAVQALEGYGEGVSGDVCNRIEYQDDRVVFKKDVATVALTGDETKWVEYGSTDTLGCYWTDVADDIFVDVSVGISNKYEKTPSGTMGFSISDKTTKLLFRVPKSQYPTVDAWRNQLRAWNSAGDPLIVKAQAKTPEIIDITELMSKDNFIKVQSNGRIVAVNEHSQAAPTAITYQKEG